METRDELQETVALNFYYLPKRRGLAILATGFGKSRVVFLVIKKMQPKKILIVVESTTNRDTTFKAQFKEWGMEDYLDRTEFQTYQTVYKWKKKDHNLDDYLVICDEADFAFTKRYGKFFREFDDVPMLAMTGYMPKKKVEMFDDTLPLFVNIPAEKLQKDKVLNKTTFIFVQYVLSSEKTIKIEYTKNGETKSFMQSENEMYKFFRKKIEKAEASVQEHIMRGNFDEAQRQEKYIFETIPRQRAEFLYNLQSSIPIVERIKEKLMADGKTKVLTFSERTSQADKLSKYSYHGSMNKEEAENNFELFNSGKIKELAVCSKVNRGANIKNLYYGILESFNGDVTALKQRNGRFMRLDPKKVGTIYVLMPYYTDGDKAYPTRAVYWARKLYTNLKGIKKDVDNLCGEFKVQLNDKN